MKIYVGTAEGKGRGVFAGERILKGQIIESAPVVEFPKEEWEHINKTVLRNYVYYWGEEYKDGAVVLGLGLLYNHSYNPNARYLDITEDRVMEFVALRDIEEDEEITVNYNGRPENKAPVWFDVI